MLIPAAAPRAQQFYALGNTPSASLARTVPHGVDARILALGCGDVRNILCTAYAETGLPERKLDFTCCDVTEDIHVRNIIFFSFLVDGSLTTEQIDRLWDIYYHLYLDGDVAATVALLHDQLDKLYASAKSLETWRTSPYGRCLRFCDKQTFRDVKAGLALYRQAIQRLHNAADPSVGKYADRYRRELARIREVLSARFGPNAVIFTGVRSVAPVVSGIAEVHKCYEHYWKEGTTNAPSSSAKKAPNPLFAEPALSGRLELHYGTDPTLGYHLATACAALAADSPLRVDLADTALPGALPLIKAARVQFRAMVRAFVDVRDRITIRVATADALAFCHTLQACASVAKPGAPLTGHWYRRQFDTKGIVLDPTEYAAAAAPLAFDVIDTSNLSDHVGTLNLAVAAVPLLAPSPYATLLTELLLSKPEDAKTLLCGDMGAVALLLGIAPAELYTNARATSPFEDVAQLGAASNGQKSRSCVSWKLAHYFSGAPASSTPPQVAITTEELTHVIRTVYRAMFNYEQDLEHLTGLRPAAVEAVVRKSRYPVFHRGSLAAFIRLVKDRVTGVDWNELTRGLPNALFLYDLGTSTDADHAYNSELNGHLYMWGVDEMPWTVPTADEVNNTEYAPLTCFGPRGLVAVTFEVPRDSLNKLYEDQRLPRGAAPLLCAALSPPYFDRKHDSTFADVHLCFGTVRALGERGTADYRIAVDEDQAGWAGRAPLVVSFLAPTRALTDTLLRQDHLPKYVELQLHGDAHTRTTFQSGLDRPGAVHRVDLDSPQVHITKHQPGHTGYPVASPSLPAQPLMAASPAPGAADCKDAGLTVAIRPSDGGIDKLTSRIALTSTQALALLVDKTIHIDVEESASPFVLNVVFSRAAKPAKKVYLVCPVRFPQPVAKAESLLRVARRSQWVEVVARPAALGAGATLDDFIWPTHPTLVDGRPVAVTAAHVNLDVLPVLDVRPRARKALDGWLPALSSSMFSRREHAINAQAPDTPGGAALGVPGRQLHPRVSFKESLHTMLMFVSGLEGGQTGLFGLAHPDRGGVHILLAMSALRLDTTGGSGAVVLDGAALPLTHAAMQDPRLRAFLERAVGGEHVCNVVVDDAELVLWKKLLPALAERCRTWTHDPATCAYVHRRRPGSTSRTATAPTIALSLEPSDPVLCACGQGRLPDRFVGLPLWDGGARPYATRIALGPLFSEPAAEPGRDLADEVAGLGLGTGDASHGGPYCRTCGATATPAGGALLRCTRCRTARYCSATCQRQDWPEHKRVCRAQAAEGAAFAPVGGFSGGSGGGGGSSDGMGMQVSPDVFRELARTYGIEY